MLQAENRKNQNPHCLPLSHIFVYQVSDRLDDVCNRTNPCPDYKMFKATIIALMVYLTFNVSTVQAANCEVNGGRNCATEAESYAMPLSNRYTYSRDFHLMGFYYRFNFASIYCQNFKNPGFQQSGKLSASSSGPWQSQANCLTAFDDIINQCYGHTDGGTYDGDAHLSAFWCGEAA
jgi:hypothetical protein